MRVGRLTSPLTRHGMVIPLVVACLAVTLLTGTLLTVLAGRQVPLLVGRTPLGAPRTQPGISQAPSSAPSLAPTPAGKELPVAQVVVNGRHVPLRSLAPAVLAWVPLNYASVGLLRQLAKQAAGAKVSIYFVTTGKAVAGLALLAAQAGGPGYRQKVVADTTDALGSAFSPTGVTAILAHHGGTVDGLDVVRLPSGQRQFEARLRVLASTIRPSATVPPRPTAPSSSPGPQVT